MSFRVILSSALASALLLSVCPSARAQQSPAQSSTSDLDAFMERVLARREVNRKVLNDYILDETETFEILGPGRYRLHRTHREYTWFVRDGIHVRSPLEFEGVAVPEEARVAYEERWLEREKARLKRKAERDRKKAEGEPQGRETKHVTVSPSGISTNVLPTEPRFVSEAYFMDFKFEPGNYLLAGRERMDGQEVLKIEYYPTRLFGGDDDEKTPREVKRGRDRDRDRELEQEIEKKMNKTALITLWVDPKEHQIVKYTFDNVWLDFLPAGWLVRIDEIRASMEMFQPFAGVWLPRGIEIAAGVTLANGSFEAHYDRAFANYRQAEVKSKIRIPKETQRSPSPSPSSREQTRSSVPHNSLSPSNFAKRGTGPLLAPPAGETGTGPFALDLPDAAPGSEIIREIRVHGNAAVADDEVLRIAGLSLGGPADPAALAAAEQRLRNSGRFETIEIRKRYRSLDDPTDVAIVLLVHEKPGVVTTPAGEVERPITRIIGSRLMALPILNYSDGYGFTYGGRFSTVDLLGMGERLSVPLTWGGTRRVGLELERTFERGPLTRLTGTAALWQRENPGFALEPDDDDSTTERRRELRGRAERNFSHVFFTGVDVSRASVDFGPLPSASQWTIGADAALDTRGNPAFPANAVYLGGGWNRLHSGTLDTNRYTVDARGYLRLVGQPVLAGRVQYFTADGPLPPYERWLIGGSSSLRGFRTGAFTGTEAVVTSAELRIPLTSVVSGGKFGVTVFADAAKVGDDLVELEEARWHRSAGAGVFLIASIFRVNLDVGRELRDGGRTRLHLSSGFAF